MKKILTIIIALLFSSFTVFNVFAQDLNTDYKTGANSLFNSIEKTVEKQQYSKRLKYYNTYADQIKQLKLKYIEYIKNKVVKMKNNDNCDKECKIVFLNKVNNTWKMLTLLENKLRNKAEIYTQKTEINFEKTYSDEIIFN